MVLLLRFLNAGLPMIRFEQGFSIRYVASIAAAKAATVIIKAYLFIHALSQADSEEYLPSRQVSSIAA